MATPLGPVLHVLARRAPVPQVGKRVEVMIPGELVSAKVDEVISDEAIVVTVDSLVTGRAGHGIKTGDPVACRRKVDDLGVERWMPIDNREVRMREIAHRLAEEEAAARALPKPEGTGLIDLKEPPSDTAKFPEDAVAYDEGGHELKIVERPAAARPRRKKA